MRNRVILSTTFFISKLKQIQRLFEYAMVKVQIKRQFRIPHAYTAINEYKNSDRIKQFKAKSNSLQKI